MNRNVLALIMKIGFYTMDPASGLRGTAGGQLFNFESLIHRGGVPSGAEAFIIPIDRKVPIAKSYPKNMIFMGNLL